MIRSVMISMDRTSQMKDLDLLE